MRSLDSHGGDSHPHPIYNIIQQIMVWQAVIFGPDDTPWEGGTFKLLLEFTEDYPNKVREGRTREGAAVPTERKKRARAMGVREWLTPFIPHTPHHATPPGAIGEVPDQDVPPQHLQRRPDLPR